MRHRATYLNKTAGRMKRNKQTTNSFGLKKGEHKWHSQITKNLSLVYRLYFPLERSFLMSSLEQVENSVGRTP